MDLSKLGTLKMKLIVENDFIPIMEYFFDHFGESDEFMTLGVPLPNHNHPIMENVPATAATLLEQGGVKLGNVALGGVQAIYLPDEKFIHGSLMLQGNLVVFFYFEDLDVGLICTSTPDGMTRTARVTLRPAKP